MYWMKSCPRCEGDLFDGSDIYGRYVSCMQCGHYLTEAEEAEVGLAARISPRAEADADRVAQLVA